MRFRFFGSLVRPTGLMLAVLLFASANADAQTSYSWSGPGALTGSNNNSVSLSGTGPNFDSGGTVAEAFTVTQGSSHFTAFCIDVWHYQNSSSFTGTEYSLNASNGTLTGSPGPESISSLVSNSNLTATQIANELTYIGYVYNQIQSVTANNTPDTNALGAVQLALWTVIDKGFSYTGGSTTMNSDYTQIQNLLAGTATTWSSSTGYVGTDGSKMVINAYNSSTTYTGASVIQVNGGPGNNNLYDQNLITWGTVSPQVAGTPEPSSFAIAGIGALAFVGYGLRRRKAQRVASPVVDLETCECDAGDAAAEIAS
jgi:PEP-CTERM motif